MTYEELITLSNGEYIEIEYKGEITRYQIEDISKEFWQFLQKVGNINVIES